MKSKRAKVSASNDASSNGSPLINWERLARAQSGKLRISILEILALDEGRVLSPTEMSIELQTSLNGLSYHVRELQKMRLLKHVRKRRVRGATEHFYRLSP